MYIIHDRFTPQIQEFLHAVRIKNIVLNHWPTRFVDGVEVMSNLYLYIKGQGVIDSPATQQILPLLNTSVDEIKKENFDGLENFYVYLQRIANDYTMLPEEIANYIEVYSPLLNIGYSDWYTTNLVYTPISAIPQDASDAGIIGYLESDGVETIWFTTEYNDPVTGDNEPLNRLTGIAIMDLDGVLFEKQYRIIEKTIGERTSYQVNSGFTYTQPSSILSKYVISAKVEIKYRRITAVNLSDPTIAAFIDKIKVRVAALNNPSSISTFGTLNLTNRTSWQNTVLTSTESSISATLKAMYLDSEVIDEDNLYYVKGTIKKTYYIKKSGIQAMKAVDFVYFFGKSLKTGYTEEEAEWWEKLIAVILAVIIIVIAVTTGLGAAAGLVNSSAVFAFASAFALVLSIGTLILTGIAYLAQSAGWYGFAAWVGKVINFLGIVATIAGIISIYAAWKTAINKAVAAEAIAKDMLKQQGKELTADAIKDLAISDQVINQLKDVAIKDIALSEVSFSTMFDVTKTMFLGSAKLTLTDIINKTVSAVQWAANYFMEKDMQQIMGDISSMEEKADSLKEQYELYKGSVDKVYYQTSELYDGYYNPYFNEYELGTGEGYDRYYKTATHWRCQNSIDWLYK